MFLRCRNGTRQIFAVGFQIDAAVAAISTAFTAAAAARLLLLARRIVPAFGSAVADKKCLVGVCNRFAGRRLVAAAGVVCVAARRHTRGADGTVQTAAAVAAMR